MKRLAFLLSLLILPFSVSAATFQAGNTIEVETQENAYAAGSIVQLSSEARGDVYLAGETIQINARVREDAMLAGQNITINGPIGDDLHAFGETILINNNVRGDLISFGEKIVISPESRISGTVVVGGANIVAQGRYDDDVRLMAADLTMDGLYLKDVTLHVGNSLSVSEDADIRGDVLLKIPEDAKISIPEGVVRGEIKKQFISKKYDAKDTPFSFAGFRMFSFLSRLIIGGLIVLLARNFAIHFGSMKPVKGTKTKSAERAFWKTLGFGLLGLFVTPLIAILFFIPVITIPLAILVLLAWGAMLYIASLLTGLVVANMLFPLNASDTNLTLVGKFALGMFSLFLIKVIPFVGGVIVMIVYFLSIGSLITYKMGALKSLRKAKIV